jgi:ATP/maltotriose-dependent transcriptional regulator MalT
MGGMPDFDRRADLAVSRRLPDVARLHLHDTAGVRARPAPPLREAVQAAPAWASPQARRAGLTRREWQVLSVLITGASNRQISARLHITPRTVTNHLASIFAKLGTRTRTEAVARAVEVASLYQS